MPELQGYFQVSRTKGRLHAHFALLTDQLRGRS